MLLISKRLRVFMTVVKYGSISKATQELALTVSPVSRMISEFEGYYNKKLFYRNGKGMFLTQDGEELYNKLTPIYDEMKEIEQHLKLSGSPRNERISIYYDWGNEPLIKQFQYLIAKETLPYSIEFIEFDDVNHEAINTPRDNAIVLSSRNVFFKEARFHQKNFTDTFSLVISRHEKTIGVPRNLILCGRQKLNSNIIKAAVKLQQERIINSINYVGSSTLMHEMILDGEGIGLVPMKYSFLSTWADARFDIPECQFPAFETHVFSSLDAKIQHKFDDMLSKLL